MRLPSDYPAIIAGGVAVLRSIGAKVRADAEHRPDAPELWLVVRDVEGLAGRLAEMPAWEWEQGFAGLSMNGQDLGVLDELLTPDEASGEQLPRPLEGDQARLIFRLRQFLQRYCDREFELDAPTA